MLRKGTQAQAALQEPGPRGTSGHRQTEEVPSPAVAQRQALYHPGSLVTMPVFRVMNIMKRLPGNFLPRLDIPTVKVFRRLFYITIPVLPALISARLYNSNCSELVSMFRSSHWNGQPSLRRSIMVYRHFSS